MQLLNPDDTQQVAGGISTYEVMVTSTLGGIFLGAVVTGNPIWWAACVTSGILVSGSILLDDYMGYEITTLKLRMN